MQTSLVLTVAESKRLIAQGVLAHPLVRQALAEGTVALCRGTTNSYLAEALLGRPIDKLAFVTGRTTPSRGAPERPAPIRLLPEVILRRGKPQEGVSLVDALETMGPGDVVIKGANALDPSRTVAGVLIGDPTGGTVGKILGRVTARKMALVIPVGLEKLVTTDLYLAQRLIAQEPSPGVPALWPITGHIITEIEALELLAGVSVAQIGAGGIFGAEGSVRLLVSGEEAEVGKARTIVEEIDEPPFPLEPNQGGSNA